MHIPSPNYTQNHTPINNSNKLSNERVIVFMWHGVAIQSAEVPLKAVINHYPALLAVGWIIQHDSTGV